MSRAVLRVMQAGPHCSVQDAGRPGHMRFGVPGSGPMDGFGFAVAHAALGNPFGGAALEVSMGGLVLECVEGAVSFAVAGGGFRVALDGTPLGPWCVATLAAGQTLSLRPGTWGSWCSIAFAGRLDARRWLGSAATHALSGFGGGALTSGQRLEVEEAERREARHATLEPPTWVRPTDRVPVVLGPQERFFAPETLAAFRSESFRLSDAYDRMGVRLSGPALPVAAKLDMPSEPVVKGAVQVSGDGVATVLLADHGTTGGYPKIGAVPRFALDAFCQMRSGDAFRFEVLSPEAALAGARRAAQAADGYLAAAGQAAGSLEQRLARMNLIGGVTAGEED
ncbi:biotin-dependent carboxyltransferase family protein [Oceaniglobus roseus]|uniref:5-oxoprolinase subunit C family protein n=1 Tax=Oceaniglobus roseus TaxID=1737570 RepID=UPI000C7EB4C8|nr:biotin-dependent carboxyltransferase family protein [Kandeliimicrobium roseum]